jgi:hypothetical protein
MEAEIAAGKMTAMAERFPVLGNLGVAKQGIMRLT